VVRGSELKLADGKDFALEFPAGVQQSETLTMRFSDGKTVEMIPHGSGKILWAADPVEFAEGYDATAALYRWALEQAGVRPAFREAQPLARSVLAFPTVLDDAVLYSFSNESAEAQPVYIVDAVTGAHIHFTLRAQGGAALLLSRDGKVLSSYGSAAVADR